MAPFYWTTTEDRGETHCLVNGGYYEAVEDGTPVAVWAGNEYVGFKTSSVPEVCMSQSPAASLFAVIHNNGAGTYYVYETVDETLSPDVDLTTAGFDFGLLEEVRFRDVSEEAPIRVSRAARVEVTQQMVDDVEQAYAGGGPTPWQEWATGVINALRSYLIDGHYPEIEYDDPYADYF